MVAEYGYKAAFGRLEMSKPSWDNAPDWAWFIAQDQDGTWCFYEEIPHRIKTGWIQDLGTQSEDCGEGDFNEDWLSTLEPRP